jgi:hypothetical protein
VGPLAAELEARYPGIRVWEDWADSCPRGMRIHCAWIGPDSPVQHIADVDFSRRADLLVKVDYIEDQPAVPAKPNIPAQSLVSFAYTVKFGTPAGIDLAQQFIDHFGHSDIPVAVRLLATRLNSRQMDLEVQTRGWAAGAAPGVPTQDWTTVRRLRLASGDVGSVELLDSERQPAARLQLVLRPEMLHDRQPPSSP